MWGHPVLDQKVINSRHFLFLLSWIFPDFQRLLTIMGRNLGLGVSRPGLFQKLLPWPWVMIFPSLSLRIQICKVRELTWSPGWSGRFPIILTFKKCFSFLAFFFFDKEISRPPPLPGMYFSKIMREFQVLDEDLKCSEPGPGSLCGLSPATPFCLSPLVCSQFISCGPGA